MLSLLMQFHDQSESYAYGFEAGKLYGEMECNKRIISGLYHQSNHQQLLLCAQTHDYQVVSIASVGDDWVTIRFRRSVGRWLLGFIPGTK